MANNFLNALIGSESGGNWQASNDEVGAGGARGHFGRLQFGHARLQDAMNAGVIPKGMTPEQFMASPAAQQAVEAWHFADIDKQAQNLGLTNYIGQTVAGVPITQNAIRAMAHLGGVGGAQKFLETGGAYNPEDAYGTSLLDYALAFNGTPTQPASVEAATQLAEAGNALAGQPAQFVNPAFGTNNPFQLPGMAPTSAPIVVPPTAPAVEAAPVSPPLPADDELLQMFISPEASQPAAQAPQQQETNADEDLLRQWLAPSTAEAPAPGFGQQTSADALAPLDLPIPGTELKPQAPEMMPNLTGIPLVGSVAGLAGYDGRPVPENASMVPALDPINAFGSKLAESVPIVGPALADLGNRVDAGFASMIEGRPVSPEERAAITAQTQEQYPVASGTGQVVGTVAPVMGVGALPVANRLMGTTGGMLSRSVMGGLSSAGIVGADTLARGGTGEEAARNALTGAVIGGAAPSIVKGAGALANNLLSPAVSPRVAELAQLARDRFGINIGPGQMSGNPTIRFLDDVVNRIPLSGGTGSREAQQVAFNRAVANTFGENAEAITPDVMANASKRIGQVFDDVATRTQRIAADPTFDQQMLDIMTNAQQTLPDAELGPLVKQFDNIVGKFQQGSNTIDGKAYQALTRKGAPLDLAMNSKDPNVRHFATQMRTALDGALERSAPQDVLDDLRMARQQWKAMRTIEDLVEKAPTGNVSPALLMGAVRSNFDRMAYGGGGDLADLARVGQQFLKSPPNSGTAERLTLINMLTHPATAGAAGAGAVLMNPGLLVPTLASAGATLAAGRLAGSALRSNWLGNALINNGLANRAPTQFPNALTTPAAPALLGTTGGGNPPLRIVVEGATPRQ